MKLKRLLLENYCSLKRTEIDFDPSINVIIGKNNVGKSSILTAISLMAELGRESTEKSRPHPAIASRGGFLNLVFGHDDSLDISICSDIELQDEEAVGQELSVDGAPTRPMTSLVFEVALEANNNVKPVVRYDVESGGHIDVDFSGDSMVDTGGSGIKFDQPRLVRCWDKVRWLDASRVPEHETAAQGTDRLAPDGQNLVQLLNAIASSNARLFSAIEAGVRQIIPEISSVRAPLRSGSSTAYGATSERYFPDLEFAWPSLAAGTKQVICLLTFIYSSPRSSILLIEEPEIHLHPDAVMKLIRVCEEVSESQDKQFVFSTHSPLLCELVGLRRAIVVTRDHENGDSRVQSLVQFAMAEKVLKRSGLGASQMLVSAKGAKTAPDFVLVCEGKTDKAIWTALIGRGGVNTSRVKIVEHDGGWQESIRVGMLLRILNDVGTICVPFVVLLDSDNKSGAKQAEAKRAGLSEDEYHVLAEKEIESYLLDADAIADALGLDQPAVKKAIAAKRGRGGKSRLDKTLSEFGVRATDRGILAAIAERIPLNDELVNILNTIASEIDSS